MQLRIPASFRIASEKDNLTCLHAYGSDIWQPKQLGCSRIAFQNARGIRYHPFPGEDVIGATEEYDIDVFGVAEPNVAFTDSFVSAVDGLINKAYGRGHIAHASMPTEKTGYFPGGIMQLIHSTTARRSVKYGGDKFGRYAWEELHGKNDNKLCIITAYRTGQKKGFRPRSPDCNTIYWQQVQAMLKEG